MSSHVQVRPLLDADLEACSALLAARHRSDLARLPFLEPSLGDPQAAAGALGAICRGPFAEAVVAESGGNVVGFCAATRVFLAPTDFAAQFLPLRSAVIPALGHAVAPGESATDIYRLLYAALAGRWVRDGLLVHRVEVVPGDRATEDAWLNLGFGRTMTAATRRTGAAVDGRAAAGVRVDRATPEDLAAVRQLSLELMEHHRSSPMFWPAIPETGPAMERFLEASLAGEIPTFLAWENGRAVGMQSFLLPGFTPPNVRSDQRLYLFEGVVSSTARGGGVGTALLQASMAWAAENGYELCTLHWASGNFSGAPFWLGHGFLPVQHTMERRIDERALWVRAEPGHSA